MKQKFIQIIAILGCILPFAVIGNAQIKKVSEFEVPFEFMVRDKAFPAGKYSLQSVTDQKTGWLMAEKSVSGNPVFLLASTIQPVDRMSETRLSFRKYGNRYFLAEFTLADFQITLPRTKAEKFLQRELSAGHQSDKAELVAIKATLPNR